MSAYESGWSVTKTTIVWIGAIVMAVVVVGTIALACVVANRNADQHRLDVIRACVGSGQSWVGGNCVDGSVVKP